MSPHWFSRPSESSPGQLNLCYNALDRRVITGAADEVGLLVGESAVSLAVLLEETAAVAGLLRALGVGIGDRVRLPIGTWSGDRVRWLLAAMRLGATLIDEGPVLLALAPTVARSDPAAGVNVIAAGPVADDPTLISWKLGLEAGRTDPAPCAEVPGDVVAWSIGGRETRAAVALEDDSAPGRVLAALTRGDPVRVT